MIDALATLTHLPLRFSRNPIAYTIDAAPDTLLDRSGLLYSLFLKKPKAVGSGDFGDIITLPGRELPPVVEVGSEVFPGAQFDVAIYLDDALARTRPEPDQTSIVTCTELISPFYVKTRIDNNDTLVPDSVQTRPLEYAIKAGLSTEQFPGWRDQFFTTYCGSTRPFLTWQPVEKWVDTTQPEFLYFLVNMNPKPAELRLRVEITYANGATETFTKKSVKTVSQYTVYCLPVGFVALDLPGNEAATTVAVHSYRVWVSNESDQRLSQVRTYYVNRDYEPQVRYLLFANSLGGYDTLRVTGTAERSLAVKGTSAQRALAPDYLPTSAELFSLNRLGEKTLTINTGLRDGDQIDYLSELTLSEEVYVLTREGLVALVPTETPLPLRSDTDELAGRTLSFRYAKAEVAWSDLPAPPTTPARPTKWVPASTFCMVDENGLRTGQMGAARLELRYQDDNSLVKPRRSKANIPGTEGYVRPVPSPVCQTTPFVNTLVQQPGRFRRNNCGGDQESTVATLTILAGTYGGETDEQLKSRIDQALQVMDTQEYANLFGSCLANPALYSYTVPAGHWHYRGNLPARLGIETNPAPFMGNAWTMQGQTSGYVFAPGSNDLDFPSTSFSADAWRLFTYGTPGAQARLRLWLNGTIYRDIAFSFNPDGYEYHNLFGHSALGNTIAVPELSKLYVQLIDIA